jgi:hypothetical protein
MGPVGKGSPGYACHHEVALLAYSNGLDPVEVGAAELMAPELAAVGLVKVGQRRRCASRKTPACGLLPKSFHSHPQQWLGRAPLAHLQIGGSRARCRTDRTDGQRPHRPWTDSCPGRSLPPKPSPPLPRPRKERRRLLGGKTGASKPGCHWDRACRQSHRLLRGRGRIRLSRGFLPHREPGQRPAGGLQLADPKRLAVGVVLAHKALACPCSCNPGRCSCHPQRWQRLGQAQRYPTAASRALCLGDRTCAGRCLLRRHCCSQEGTVGHPCHPGIPPPVHCQGNNLVRSRGTKLPRPELSALGVVLAQENVTAPRRTLARKASFGDPCHPDIPLPRPQQGRAPRRRKGCQTGGAKGQDLGHRQLEALS